MNLIDLFIKRRKKVERLTKALAESHKQFFDLDAECQKNMARQKSHYAAKLLRQEVELRDERKERITAEDELQRVELEMSNKVVELAQTHADMVDKYVALKAIVLAIDDERIKEAVKE